MKNIMLKFLGLFAAATMLFACSEEFLTQAPQGSLNEATLANEVGVNASLISAYSVLDGWAETWGLGATWPQSGSNWIWGSVISDEAYKGSESGDQIEAQQLELFQWSPGNPYFDAKFKILYEGIARSNATLNLLSGAVEAGESFSNPSGLEAEAKFLRAHYHFDGYKLWKNVPYIDETVREYRVSNAADIMPQIQADFQFAVDNLPVDQSAVGRATKGGAQAYLGKTFLYEGKYAEAKAQFDAVVNSGKYALQPCFHDPFTVEGENGSEMVLSIQASVNDGTSEGQNGNFADRLNYPNGGGTFSCCGFHQPSQNLVNSHRVDANGLPLLESFNDADAPEATGADSDPIDPRVDWTVGRDNVPYLTYGNHGPDWIRARSFAGPYSPKKFIHDPGENAEVSWSNQQLSAVNMPLIRYADVLLMLAECEVELGNLERARELVNLIRERAGNCAQGPDGGAVPIDDPSITWANYEVGTYDAAWTDQGVAREAVRMERKIELALEGHRFFDLRRWGVAQQVMTDYLSVESNKRDYLKTATAWDSKFELYPLPSIQIELSKIDGVPQLQQNPGY